MHDTKTLILSVPYFIHAVDHSRVILKERDPDVIGSDYINANFVGVSSTAEAFLQVERKMPEANISFSKHLHKQLSNGRSVFTCHLHQICILT